MSSQQPLRVNSRPTLSRVPSGTAPATLPEVHVIVRLPYNRPPDAPLPPPQVSESRDARSDVDPY